ncbi:hypothetical protein GCM10020218_008590 [Dactylosporangium vinaceum]
MRPSPLTLSQQGGEAEDSLIREVPGRAGAVLTTPGRAGTARRCGPGKRDEEEYVRNRRLKVSQNHTGSNLVDTGWERCAPAAVGWLRGTPGRQMGGSPGGHGDVLRGSRGEAAGTKSGSSFVERITVNTGTVPVSPVVCASGVDDRAGPIVGRSGWDGAEPS